MLRITEPDLPNLQIRFLGPSQAQRWPSAKARPEGMKSLVGILSNTCPAGSTRHKAPNPCIEANQNDSPSQARPSVALIPDMLAPSIQEVNLHARKKKRRKNRIGCVLGLRNPALLQRMNHPFMIFLFPHETAEEEFHGSTGSLLCIKSHEMAHKKPTMLALLSYIFSESDPEINRRGKRRQIGMP